MSDMTFEEWMAELEEFATDELPADTSCWTAYWEAGISPADALEDRENW